VNSHSYLTIFTSFAGYIDKAVVSEVSSPTILDYPGVRSVTNQQHRMIDGSPRRAPKNALTIALPSCGTHSGSDRSILKHLDDSVIVGIIPGFSRHIGNLYQIIC
jgi:hypothetical protein